MDEAEQLMFGADKVRLDRFDGLLGLRFPPTSAADAAAAAATSSAARRLLRPLRRVQQRVLPDAVGSVRVQRVHLAERKTL